MFLVDATPRCCQPGCLKQWKFTLSQFWREARSQNSGVCRAKALFPASLPAPVTSSNPGFVDTALLFLPLSSPGPLPCVSVSVFPSHLFKGLIGFTTHSTPQ